MTLAVAFGALRANLSPASATDGCPAPIAIEDPFADLDDLKTDEEQREALHENLDHELAKHKKRCDKTQNQASQSAQSAASAGGGQSGAQQADGQQSADGSGASSAQAQSQSQSQAQSQAQSQSQSQGQSQSQAQNQAQGQGQGQGQSSASQQQQQSTGTASQANQTGAYSSPWATQQPAAGSGQVMLEPMAEPTQDAAQQAGSSGASQATTDPAGAAGQSATGQSATGQSKEQESLFLKTYGGQQTLENDKIEDIASRYKTSQRYGYPGNTGTNHQNPNYSDPGKNPGQSTTISADDAVVAALKKRLANEPDPAKKKEIQAEIDKYQKK